jgi:hypothetical protein
MRRVSRKLNSFGKRSPIYLTPRQSVLDSISQCIFRPPLDIETVSVGVMSGPSPIQRAVSSRTRFSSDAVSGSTSTMNNETAEVNHIVNKAVDGNEKEGAVGSSGEGSEGVSLGARDVSLCSAFLID